MSARDAFHNAVKVALEKERWTITADPLKLQWGDVELYVDLAADRLVAADRADEKIAVEIKSFLGQSEIYEFHGALGQFINYRTILAQQERDRVLYLAVPVDTYDSFFTLPFTQTVVQQNQLKLIVYNPEKQELVLWQS
ncbi:MAG: XisH family protein [Verrucomicrobia bacterium]|jgi:hypothetical protein|nr:XisH family protein [Leptolyngbya sp. ES-bin-22]